MFARLSASLLPSWPRKCNVTAGSEWNFAGRLVERLGPGSCFIDAATGRTIGPEELPRLIAASGTALISSGLKRGDRVLIGCALSPSSALVYLGAMYAGLVAVPVDERALAASPAALIEATDARAVWSETSIGGEWGREGSVIRLEGDLDRGIGETQPPAPCTKDDLAALMATSGSTGVPRFVMVSHGNLVANTEAIVRSQDLGTDERAMLILPVSYCFGASVMHSHLYQGGSVVCDRRFMFPDKVLQSLVQYGCTTFAGVPTVYNVLLRRSSIRKVSMPGLRRFLQAGGGLASERIGEMRELFPQARFYVMYGQTEATARISCMDPDRWSEKQGSVGQPLDNLTISIVDEEGKAVPQGHVGQLMVMGPSICAGYLNDPEESRRVFRDGWLRTGDLARQDEDGFLWIEGRAGSFLKIRGTRVSLAEVETKVTAIAGVYECGACAVDHPEAGEALLLLVVPDHGARLATEEIRRHLPAQWTLDSIRIVTELPKTSAGKIDRPALSAMGKELNGTAK
jgi:acyl-CoA synthetase (AMP-forming)/AMP-acid ligase II